MFYNALIFLTPCAVQAIMRHLISAVANVFNVNGDEEGV